MTGWGLVGLGWRWSEGWFLGGAIAGLVVGCYGADRHADWPGTWWVSGARGDRDLTAPGSAGGAVA